MKVLVTGGCGFIGSNFIKYVLSHYETFPDVKVINLDKQTYAGRGKNIEHLGLGTHPLYRLVLGDICNRSLVEKLFEEEKPDLVFNFAAESHVDRSITSPVDFIATNVIGTANLLEASRRTEVDRFVQVSTDEVYGSIEQGSFDEQARLDPSSPYSASKASAELNALAYFKTFEVPVIVTRSANNFGPYQFPEKLLPLFITNLIQGKKVPLMWTPENPGLNVRDWLHVEDNCRAIWFLSRKGNPGEVYNISGENERTNMQITDSLLRYFNFGEEMIEHMPHRKGHDFRYSISGEKLHQLGFQHHHKDLEKDIAELCEWYVKNENWWRPLKK